MCDLISLKPVSVSQNAVQILPLAALLQLQPILMPRVETETCLELAALAFSAQFAGTYISGKYLEGLEQLFRSNRIHWQNARKRLAEKECSALSHIDPIPEVVTNFLESTTQLHAGGLFFPNFINDPTVTVLPGFEPEFVPEINQQSVGKNQPVKFKKIGFDVRVCEQLFEFQVLQQEQQPALNNYLLATDWNSQTESKFRDASRILIAQLHAPGDSSESKIRRLHAACRILSQMAQLSIEKLASIPISRRGTLHVDLKCGIVRRDLKVVAPRTDRENGPRWLRRWLRSPIPPEVLVILRTAAAENPSARTVGDLLVAARLTPKKCHHLLNEDRQESRVHESLRVARSLGTFLISQGVHASTLSRTLGDVTLLPSAHQYYLVLDQQVVHAAINLWCKAVGLKEVLMPKEGVMIGSPKVPTFVEMAKSFQVIQEENHKERMAITTRAGLDDVI
jgi:hypothetical protein